MSHLNITELVDNCVLQQIQDVYSKFTGMAAIVIDKHGLPVTKASGSPRFCFALSCGSELGQKRCDKCDCNEFLYMLEKGTESCYVCHAGLVFYVAPIVVNDKIVGGFISGKEQTNETDKGQEFLSDFSKIITEAAHSNFLALQRSRYLEEQSAASRLCMGKRVPELKETEYHVRTMLEQLMDHIRDKNRRTHFTLQIDETVPPYVMGDPEQIAQILYQLLESNRNLAKNDSSINGRKVSIAVNSQKKFYSTWLVVEVEDTGTSISDQALEELQKELTKENWEDENITEIGLQKIVAMVHQMFGEIEVRKAQGGWIIYTVRLPQLEVSGE